MNHRTTNAHGEKMKLIIMMITHGKEMENTQYCMEKEYEENVRQEETKISWVRDRSRVRHPKEHPRSTSHRDRDSVEGDQEGPLKELVGTVPWKTGVASWASVSRPPRGGALLWTQEAEKGIGGGGRNIVLRVVFQNMCGISAEMPHQNLQV